jgi:hypothetical protein
MALVKPLQDLHGLFATEVGKACCLEPGLPLRRMWIELGGKVRRNRIRQWELICRRLPLC